MSMRVVIFCHSILSDWNHGNAHFLRGIVTELQSRDHDVRVFEPRDAWSAANLVADAGPGALDAVKTWYPRLESHRYDPATLDLDEALDGADLVLVHEWSAPALVAQIGRRRAAGAGFHLLFHDTHHRSVTEPDAMAAYDLDAYDGVLAFGDVIRERYIERGWANRAWTWHEAADVRLFHPAAQATARSAGDLVWIGNWGDEERSREIRDYLIGPARDLGLRAQVYGVRYPDDATTELADAGIRYGGWVPNYRVPEVFAQFGVTVHIPRRPYVEALPGIPTIRMFEALACGIPLVSCDWHDAEALFRETDYLRVRTPDAMRLALRDVLNDGALAASLVESGRQTILARHTCAHRIDELFAIVGALQGTPVEKALTV
jgi:spore maturation protein CgeB